MPGVVRTFLCERAPVSRRIFLKTIYIDTIPGWSRKTLNHRRPVAIFQSCLCRVALITSGFVLCASGDNNENKEVEGVDFNLYANTGATKPLLIVVLGSYSIISLTIRGPVIYGPSNSRGVIVARNAFPLLRFRRRNYFIIKSLFR